MRPILISGAMESEISILKEKLSAKLCKNISGFEFYQANFENYPIIISKTNIGISNSAIATTLGILEFDPVCVINQGTAGSHSRKVLRGDIVIGCKALNINSFEKDSSDFTTWKHTNFSEYDDNSCDEFLACEKLCQILMNLDCKNIHFGTIGSGDVWNKSTEFIDFLNEKYQTLCEDMETVSIYNVCNKFSLPVIGIRVISNNEILGQSYDKNASAEPVVISVLEKIIKLFI